MDDINLYSFDAKLAISLLLVQNFPQIDKYFLSCVY